MNIKRLAYVYTALAIVFGALVPIMLKAASGTNLFEFMFLTYLVSTAVALSYVAFKGKWGKLKEYLGNHRQFATIGLMGITNYALMEFGLAYAEKFVSVPLASVVYRTFPLLMLAFIPLILRERISKYQLAALLMGFAGIFIVFTGGSLSLFSGYNPTIMVLLVFLAVSAAIGNLMVKKQTYDIDCGVAIFSIANLAVFFLLFAINGFPTSALTPKVIGAMLYVAIEYNVLNGLMFWAALRVLKATLVANMSIFSPFLTFLFAYLILGQQIQTYYILIAVLGAIGILIQSADKVGGTYKTKSKFTIFDVTGAFQNTGEIAITHTISSGGRVLAAKISAEHEEHLSSMSAAGRYANIYLANQLHEKESDFIKDVLSAKDGEIVIIKAGSSEDGEKFFTDLSDRIHGL